MSDKDRSRKRVRPYPEPHACFLALLEKQGPYDNESILAFKCRLAYVKTARELWLAAYEASQGVMSQACRLLGISDRNSGVMLRNCGLTREILHQAFIGDVPLDIQAVQD